MDAMDTEPYLVHNESGHFRYRTSWPTARANPSDYLLIWCTAGELDLVLDRERRFRARTGDLVLLEPGHPHRYAAYEEGEWEWWWLHFGGTAAPTLAGGIGSAEAPIRTFGADSHTQARFAELVAVSTEQAVASASTTQLFLDACCHALLAGVNRSLELRTSELDTTQLGTRRITLWILDHLGTSFGLDELAEAVGWSTSQLNRVMTRDVGLPPMQYATRLRVREAQRLLRVTDFPIATIAAMVGFEDPLYFSRRFHQLVGDAPRSWRRAVRAIPPAR